MTNGLNAAEVVAGDTKNVIMALDDAMMTQMTTFTSTVQAARVIGLPIAESQDLFAEMYVGIGLVLDGRQAMRRTVSKMHGIAKRHGLAEVLEGCLGGFPMMKRQPRPEPVEHAS